MNNMCTNSKADRKMLHKKFVNLGRERMSVTHKLEVMLPEIYEKEIYKDYGCSSIYEYAVKFGGGLSAGVVDKVLRVKEQLKDCPTMFAQIETQGVHKIAVLAGITKPENEEKMTDVVQNMSKAAVHEYSKKIRGKSPRVTVKIELDEEMERMFLKLKKKLKTSTNKETLKRLLQAMDEQLFLEKKSNQRNSTSAAAKQSGKNNENSTKANRFGAELTDSEIAPKPKMASVSQKQSTFSREKTNANHIKPMAPHKKSQPPRHVSTKTTSPIHKKTNGTCHYPNCTRPIEHIHHKDGFAKTKSHNNIIGLCKIHHEFAHNGIDKPICGTDILYRQNRAQALLSPKA